MNQKTFKKYRLTEGGQLSDLSLDLEATIKEKVAPMLEETMEKHWGITIPQIESDITDKLKSPQIQIYVSPQLAFAEAKHFFKAEFLKKSLAQHLGNVSQLAKVLRIDRRSVHRAIKSLDIDMETLRGKEDPSRFREEIIDRTIRSALDHYKELIHPQKMEDLYSDIPALSRNIAKVLPDQEMSWKQAEKEFERQFLSLALAEQQHKVVETAQKLKMRVETLYRKIRRLGLD